MTWVEPVIKKKGYYICDEHKKPRGWSNSIEVRWSKGYHFSGQRSNFCNITSLIKFAKKNPLMVDNCCSLQINDSFLSRWVLSTIIQSKENMSPKIKEWNEYLGCKR